MTGNELFALSAGYLLSLIHIYRQDPEHPGVCILDKENSGEYDPTTYPVANSFTEFLGMLHITEGEMLRFGDDLRKELADPRVIEVPTGEGDRQELAERAARREEPVSYTHLDVYKRQEKEKEKEKEKKMFTPPTLAQVQAYCAGRGSPVDPQRFVDFYTANGWRLGPNPMRDWKAALRTWERRGAAAQENPFLREDV